MDTRARAFLNAAELATLDSFDAVIIWGYPLQSHIHSYIHSCWNKTFTALGKPTFWYTDEQHDTQRTYKNCLFITEGFRDDKIPLDASNTYCVKFAIQPQKYLNCGARLIELRFRVKQFADRNSSWILDDGTHRLEPISEDAEYERLASNEGVSKSFRGLYTTPMNYEALYMYEATDLFPWEIDFQDALLRKPEPIAIYVGTPQNKERWNEFEKVAVQYGIRTVSHNLQEHPISFEENRERVRNASLAPDFCTSATILNDTIQGHLFKNISYGILPITDSKSAYELFGDHVVYDTDMGTLVAKGLAALADIPRRQAAMKYIAERHTYIQRARDILRVIGKGRPTRLSIPPAVCNNWNQVTLITALQDIGREAVDGRKFSDYVSWFFPMLLLPAPMVIYVEPSLVEFVKIIRKDLPTRVISQGFVSSPFRWALDTVTNILQNPHFVQQNPSDLLNRLPAYSVLTSNKFAWVWNTIHENPFQTDLFFWIDAGLSRFWSGLDVTKTAIHPRNLRFMRTTSCIYSQVGDYREQFIRDAFQGNKHSTEEIIGSNVNTIMAGFFGGTGEAMAQLAMFGMNTFVFEMLAKQRIDGEQPILYLYLQEHPERFLLVPSYPGKLCVNFLLLSSGELILPDEGLR